MDQKLTDSIPKLKGNTRKAIQKRDNKLPNESDKTAVSNVPRGNTSPDMNSYTLNLYMGQSAFVGIESDSSSSSKTNLTFKQPSDFGIIKGAIKGLESDFIIELLTDKYQVKDTIINKNNYQFNYVSPGSYRIRIIEDQNQNQKWDAGNPLDLRPAENIYYLNEVITVKANWEVIDKNFDFNVDKPVNDSEEK